MALVGDELYVANTDAVRELPLHAGQTQITARRRQGARPAGPADQPPLDQEPHRQPGRHEALRDRRLQHQHRRERHGRTRTAAPRSGKSTARRASDASSPRACAIPNGLGWEPTTGALWTVVNERDELGNDLVPDYMTAVKDGGFYGWPYSYYGQHVDTRVEAAAARPGRQGDRRRTMRWARTPPRWAWPSTRATPSRRSTGAAPSSASTARGTASRRAATRWSSCPSRAAGRRRRRRTS